MSVNQNDVIRRHTSSYHLVQKSIMESSFDAPIRTQREVLVLEEAEDNGLMSKIKSKVNNLKSSLKEKVAQKAKESKESSKENYDNQKSKAKKFIEEHPGQVAGAGAALVTAGAGAKVLFGDSDEDKNNDGSDKEIKESDYSDELYSDKRNDGDPSKEDNNISNVTEAGKKDSGVEYARDTLPKEEGLTGKSEPEGLTESSYCCGNCEKEGHNNSDSCCSKEAKDTGVISESTQEPAKPLNHFSFISNIL